MHSVALSQTVGQLVVDLEYNLDFNEFTNKHISIQILQHFTDYSGHELNVSLYFWLSETDDKCEHILVSCLQSQKTDM